MNLDQYIIQLAANATTITDLLQHVSPDHARWKPAPEEWSMLEVINHLYDEEREDFRQRLDFTLHHPSQPWPPIDPQGWVTARAYQQRDLQQSLANFRTERQHSLDWLQLLTAPDWTRAVQHPSGMVIRAGDLLASWVAHDFLHLRQLVELHYHAVALRSAPYSVEYAGEW